MVNAAIYARISDDTEGRAAGVNRQIEDATALALRLGWSITLPPFVDNDISASTRSRAARPAFNALVRAVEGGEVRGVAYYSSSRLTRRPAEFETIISLVERTGVALASVVSGNADLSTADGRMIARILAAQDAAEAERIGERVKRAAQQRIASNKPHWSSRGLGFEKGGQVIIPEEAEIIREAASRIAHEGWSLGMVTRDWNERGIPTLRTAKGWSSIAVRRVLLSPRIAGLVADKGEIVGKFTDDPIITPELQAEVRAATAARKAGMRVTYKERRHVLAGFLVCGKCGHPIKMNARLNEDGSLRKDSYVVCSKSQFGCGRISRNLLMLDEYIDGLVRLRLESWRPVGALEPSPEDVEASQSLRGRLRELEEDIAELQQAFEAGGMRFRDYNAALNALRAQQEASERALSALLAPTYTPDDLDASATWIDGSLAERREVLGILIDHIRLLPMGGGIGPQKVRERIPETTEVIWR